MVIRKAKYSITPLPSTSFALRVVLSRIGTSCGIKLSTGNAVGLCLCIAFERKVPKWSSHTNQFRLVSLHAVLSSRLYLVSVYDQVFIAMTTHLPSNTQVTSHKSLIMVNICTSFELGETSMGVGGVHSHVITDEEQYAGVDASFSWYPTVVDFGQDGLYAVQPTTPPFTDDSVPDGVDGHACALSVAADGMPHPRFVTFCGASSCGHGDPTKYRVVRYKGPNKHGQRIDIPVYVKIHDETGKHFVRLECVTPELPPTKACESSHKRLRTQPTRKCKSSHKRLRTEV